MRKVVVRLVLSQEFTIFANAKFGDGRPCALRPMLHDRLTSFDLAKSGKFTSGVVIFLRTIAESLTYYIVCV